MFPFYYSSSICELNAVDLVLRKEEKPCERDTGKYCLEFKRRRERGLSQDELCKHPDKFGRLIIRINWLQMNEKLFP